MIAFGIYAQKNKSVVFLDKQAPAELEDDATQKC